MSGKIVETKTSKKAEKAARTEARKTRYYDIKRRVLAWEKENYTSLAVVESGDGWYKMFDHSAIIYVCTLAKRLSLRASLSSDTDYEQTSDAPVFLFRDFTKFEERLKRLKIYRKSSTTGAVVFDLGYKVDAAELVSLMKEDERLREQSNQLAMPKVVLPGLRNELRILAKKLFEITRRMNPVAREMVGNDVIRLVGRANVNFVEMANGMIDARQYLKKLSKDLKRLDAMMLLMSDLRLIEDQKNYEIIVQVGRVRKKALAALTKEEGRVEQDSQPGVAL